MMGWWWWGFPVFEISRGFLVACLAPWVSLGNKKGFMALACRLGKRVLGFYVTGGWLLSIYSNRDCICWNVLSPHSLLRVLFLFLFLFFVHPCSQEKQCFFVLEAG